MGFVVRFAISILLCCVSLALLGQEQAFRFHHLADELTSSQFNYYLYQDSTGFVWISSTNGLNRFDGLEVRQMHPFKDSTNTIQSPFFEDDNQDLWFQSDKQLCRYERRTDSFHSTGMVGRPVWIEGNSIWLAHGGQLSICDKQTGQVQAQWPVERGFGPVLCMHQQQNGKGKLLFLPKGSGFLVLQIHREGSLDTLFSLLGKPAFRAAAFYCENDTTWWVGADTGLVRVRPGPGGSVQVFSGFAGGVPASVKGIAPLDADRLIVATHKQGLFLFEKKGEGGTFTHRIYRDNGGSVEPFDEQVDAIYLDRDHNLWVATQGNGIFFTNFKKRKFRTALQRSPGMPKGLHQIENMAMDSQGRIWCLTKNGIAVIDSSGRLVEGYEQYLGDRLPFGGEEPMHIFCDSHDRIWIGMQSKLFMIPAFGKKIAAVPGSRGTIFIGKLNDGLAAATMDPHLKEIRFNAGQPVLANLPGLEDYPGSYAMFFQNGSGDAFFCRDNREMLVFRQDGRALRFQQAFPLNGLVTGFAGNPSLDTVWASTSGGLYFFVKKGQAWSLARDTVFPKETLNGILRSKAGILWLSAANGLYGYRPGPGMWKKYGLADGLQASEFNFWSALKVSERRFLFGGVNGVNVFDPLAVQDLSVGARPVITQITVQDGLPLPPYSMRKGAPSNISLLGEIVLKYEDNSPRIQFAALEYSDPSSNQFRYSLEGPNRIISNVGPEHAVSFANLREGVYQFKLWASNSDGLFSDPDRPASLKIVVLPPWYRSAPAYAAYVALAFLALLAFYRNRINQVKRQEAARRREAEFKQKEAEFRQKEAEYKLLVAETETAVLRLQMNPHFIFNSMNSINSYILQHDVETASNYLGRFAGLMRKILKYAANKYISVAQEIELLEMYLETEAMRFEGNFNYRFVVDERLDPDETILPTMILQPFVENAIWHGLSSNDGTGQVTVRFEQQGDSLVCCVEDNGQGREAAGRLKDKSGKHESKALSITQRRLQLLQQEEGREAHFEIEDKKSENGQALGTRVVLRLPLL